jgi:hypothetical protein
MLDAYDEILEDESVIEVGRLRLHTIHPPATRPARCASASRARRCCSAATPSSPAAPGNTSFEGGDFDTIIASIDRACSPAAADTLVLPGHGDDTTIGTERPTCRSGSTGAGDGRPEADLHVPSLRRRHRRRHRPERRTPHALPDMERRSTRSRVTRDDGRTDSPAQRTRPGPQPNARACWALLQHRSDGVGAVVALDGQPGDGERIALGSSDGVHHDARRPVARSDGLLAATPVVVPVGIGEGHDFAADQVLEPCLARSHLVAYLWARQPRVGQVASPAARDPPRASTSPSAPARSTPSWAPTARASRPWPTLLGSPEYEVTAGTIRFKGDDITDWDVRRAGQGRHVPRLPVPPGDRRRVGASTSCARRCRPARASTCRCSSCACRSWSGWSASTWTRPSPTATSTRASPAARRSATRSCRWPSSSPRWPSSTRPTPASTSTPCGRGQGRAGGARATVPSSACWPSPTTSACSTTSQPDHVHILVDGRIVDSGGMELAERLEAEGYEAWR